jgi:Acyl dehydratase
MKMGINLGWNKVRFMHPVAVGSKIRTVWEMEKRYPKRRDVRANKRDDRGN